VNIGSVVQTASGPKRGNKGKWDKNPPKDKGTLVEKKPWDVAKVRCFRYEELGHFAKYYEKVRQD
jgi:saccharopine dehydrogenase-like NADP-dependent oxidoreductase